MRGSLFVALVVVAAVGGCGESGVLTIGDDASSTDGASVIDTDVGDTDDDHPGSGSGSGTDGTDDTAIVDSDAGTTTNPFDSPRLAWDGRVVHTFVPYLPGPGAGCVVTITERGEEIAATPPLTASCPACTRFFEVRLTQGSNLCLESWGDTEWRGVELRPTGRIAITEIYLGQGGGPVPRTTRPNGVLQGSTLLYTFSESAFPLWKTERSKGRIELTPIP